PRCWKVQENCRGNLTRIAAPVFLTSTAKAVRPSTVARQVSVKRHLPFALTTLRLVLGPVALGGAKRLECAGMTALWNWATCRPVGKRRRVAALYTQTPRNSALINILAGRRVKTHEHQNRQHQEGMKKVHCYILAIAALIVGFIIGLLVNHRHYISNRNAMIVSYEHRQAAQALTTLISLRGSDTNAVSESLEHQLDIGAFALFANLEQYPDMKFADSYRSTLQAIAAYRNKHPHHCNDTNLNSLIDDVLARVSNKTGR
ncbi:MAG: hypothetical protein NTZ16_01175, partial [Verrucomicrobia bacterium]|nr:hypothetical protein [Verrucomicrobiota bacterium]